MAIGLPAVFAVSLVKSQPYKTSWTARLLNEFPTIINYLNGTNAPYSKAVPQFDKDFIDANASKILSSAQTINEKAEKIALYEAFLQNLNPSYLLASLVHPCKTLLCL